MQISTAAVVAVLSLVVIDACAQNSDRAENVRAHVRAMTFNIRYDTPFDGENAWPQRHHEVIKLITFYAPDVLGVQECLARQYADLRAGLTGYTSYGVGRDDGAAGGEFAPIFVRSERMTIGETGTFWLSPTPAMPSKGWDAALPRIASWARLEDRQTGSRLLLVNTHWDHEGSLARHKSAELIRDWMMANMEQDETPVLLGDFNATPGSLSYKVLSDAIFLQNAKALSQTTPFGPPGTFSDFKVFKSDDAPIDHIFVGRDTEVMRHGVITQHSAGILPSDHYPVIVDIMTATRR